MANKYKVIKTFRDEGNVWRLQGAVIELALDVARQLMASRVVAPILESLTPKKVETAEKQLGTENAVAKTEKKKGGF